jgi:RNA polymerase sigma-54 factor
MLKQTLQQKLLQKLSPQQIQLMKLLQVPTIELEQRIKEEMEANPALEEGAEQVETENEFDQYEEHDDYERDNEVSEAQKEFDINDYLDDDTPSYKLAVNNKGADDEEKSIPFVSGISFHERLLSQLGMRTLTDEEEIIAKTIIGNLDDSGYLRRDLLSISDDLAFSQGINTDEETLNRLLEIIQDFDPAGVGARTLQECLLLQIKRKGKRESVALATLILEKYFEEFTKKHYSKIVKRLNLEEEELKAAMDEILKLNPKPGNSSSSGNSKDSQAIVPDFIITINDGELQLALNGRNAPELRISNDYKEMLKTYAETKSKDKAQKDAVLFVKSKIDSAKWFIDAIKQRQQTLLFTMNAIMEYQKEFFLEGDETLLRPMILKDIAEIVNLDISTISRVANSKYVQTPYGTYLLKYFFSEALSTDSGEEVSTREVKQILQDSIEHENKRKPLTDEKLAELLQEKGYNIARRTVAKYREQLNIPVARMRKEL